MRKKGASPQRTWTTMEVIYVARFYECDGYKFVALALDRTPAMVVRLYIEMRRNHELEYFKRMWDEIHNWR